MADGAAIHVKKKISNLPEQRLGSHNHELYFVSIELEKIRLVLGFYIVKTTDTGLWGELSGWFHAEVQLGVIGIAVESKAVVADKPPRGSM